MLPKNNTPFLPKVSRRFPSARSTNGLVADLIAGGNYPANGAVFVATSQTAGRGQGSNTWYASPGKNLTLSVAAYPSFLAVDDLFALNQVAALAVTRTLMALLPPPHGTRVRAKYPNDVYVGQQKIAGILIQNGLRGRHVAWTVLGIGLNVNEAAFPGPLQRTATSPRLLTGRSYNLEEVLAQLLDHLRATYELARTNLPALQREWDSLLTGRGIRGPLASAADDGP